MQKSREGGRKKASIYLETDVDGIRPGTKNGRARVPYTVQLENAGVKTC